MLKELAEQKELTFSPKTNVRNTSRKIYPTNSEYKSIMERINIKNKIH